METEQATPNADTQPSSAVDRAAGEPTKDANGVFTPEQQAIIDAIVSREKAEVRRRFQTEYGNPDELLAAKQELAKLREAEMSEVEKLNQKIADMEAAQQQLKAQAEAERLNALRLRVGQELGLPPVLAQRLAGADEDALKADAQIILSTLSQSQTLKIPSIDATAGGGQQSSGKRMAKLTPGQEQAARDAGMSFDDYATLLGNLGLEE